jgi:hypothetical protein
MDSTNCKIQNTIGLGLGYTYMCIVIATIVSTCYCIYDASKTPGNDAVAFLLPYISSIVFFITCITVCMLNMSNICKWNGIVGWPLILFALFILGNIMFQYYIKLTTPTTPTTTPTL